MIDFKTYVPLVISLLTILSYLLAINEYYENKAYWDFFHIDDSIRTNMRSGFHAEYLSYALIITFIFIAIDNMLVFFANKLENKILFSLLYFGICLILFVVVFISLYFITIKFHLTDVNERNMWGDESEFLKHIRKIYKLQLIKLGISYWLIIIALYFYSILNYYLLSALIFASAFIFLQFQNYSQKQLSIIDKKWFDIVKEDNGSTYVILAHNGNSIQMNRCTLKKDILTINLDDVKIQTDNCINYQTTYVRKFEKTCNGSICTEHHIASYRKDFKRKKHFKRSSK